ncbi:hypothetical protein DV736_g6346, partial [Chaetothyriales sp. CBS 134916]
MAGIDATHDTESSEVETTPTAHESPVSAAQTATQKPSCTENSRVPDAPLEVSGSCPYTCHDSPSLDLPEGSAMAQMPVMEAEPRGSMNMATTMTKSDLRSTLSASLAPKAGIVPSQMDSPHTINETADSDLEVRTVKSLKQPLSRSLSQTSSVDSLHDAAKSAFGTMQVDTPKAEMALPAKESKTSVRPAKSYILPDGTVVSGKGLGRGRPGIKRGPRIPKYKLDDPTVVSGTDSPVPISASAKTPGFRQVSRKRKRALSGASNAYSPGSSLTSGSRESSPEYNPTGTTRSGRITQKPTSVIAQSSENAGTVTKRSRLHSTISASNAAKMHPKIKRRVYRGREQLALCEHCLRGYGPAGNVIVFCDACNKCWHQRCHDPQVASSVVADTKAQWYCADCDRILHGKKTKKAKAVVASVVATAADILPTFTDPPVPGSSLTTAQKTSYLQSLSKDELIRALLHASDHAPALPLFKVAVQTLPAAKFFSNYTTPASATPVYHSAADAAKADDGEDEGYETYVDEHALLYPRPGQGIELPPEKDDMHMLLESKDSRTFSHWHGRIVLGTIAAAWNPRNRPKNRSTFVPSVGPAKSNATAVGVSALTVNGWAWFVLSNGQTQMQSFILRDAGGQLPKCQRCKAKGTDCIYAPSKRASTNANASSLFLSDNTSESTNASERHATSPSSNARAAQNTPGFASDPTSNGSNGPRGRRIIALEESTVMLALDNFFKHIHPIPVFSFLHKASIIQRYESGTVDTGLILSIIGIASQMTNLGPGMREYGSDCISAAESLVMRDISKPSVIKIQTLVLIIQHRKMCRRFTNAFMLLATAMRFAFALRLNHEASNLCFLAQESRRRLMWALYILDSTIAGGVPDLMLCNPEALHIQLPCQERNFEFDLEQETEPLKPRQPKAPLSESVGSLGIYIRVMWIRARIVKATKEILTTDVFEPMRLQRMVEGFTEELNDLHASLPASFQFSEKNLHLRAYSVRLCPYSLIHIWWRQCWCDLTRITMPGLQEGLPQDKINRLDQRFVNYCHWQCYDNARAMSDIFRISQGESLGFTKESATTRARYCLEAIEHLPMSTPAGDQMQDDLRRLIGRGASSGFSETPPGTPVEVPAGANNSTRPSDVTSRQNYVSHNIVKQMDLLDDSESLMMPTRSNANIHNGHGTELNPIEIPVDALASSLSVEANQVTSLADQSAPPSDHINFTAPNAFQGALVGYDFGLNTHSGDTFNWFSNIWDDGDFQGSTAPPPWSMQTGP